MARTMLYENNLPKYFWGKAINTTCYVINRVTIRSLLSKTPYELYKGRKPNVSHLRSFGCKCFILNNRKHLIGKMDFSGLSDRRRQRQTVGGDGATVGFWAPMNIPKCS